MPVKVESIGGRSRPRELASARWPGVNLLVFLAGPRASREPSVSPVTVAYGH